MFCAGTCLDKQFSRLQMGMGNWTTREEKLLIELQLSR